jgi:2-polyprenyl-3-methyl-5-hydroxy-6-metoxy-1,4-benzoquinol methylase
VTRCRPCGGNFTNNNSLPRTAECPACLGHRTSLHLRKDSYRVHRCSSCELLFVHPQPSKEELEKLYSAAYFGRGGKYDAALPRYDDPNWLNDEGKVAIIKRWRSGGSLLDVGCAVGGFLAVAREHGFEVEGVELAPYAAEQARARLQVNVINSDIYSADLASESYDVITMWDVIEHLSDPNVALDRIFKALRPGGLLAFSTGDASSAWARLMGKRWPLLTPPQHLYFFSQRSISELLGRHRLSVKEIRHQGKWVTVGFVLFKARESFGRMMAPLAAAARWTGVQHWKLSINLGDIMTVMAEKA